MNPLTFDQLLTIASFAVAAIALLHNAHRDSKADDEHMKAQAAETRSMADKLDAISDMSRETRDTVREMSRQLNDHSQQLARMEEQIKEHSRRIDEVEDRLGNIGIGGTD